MTPIAERFADLNSITTSLGQILGLVGMALFAINLILAGRFKWLDKHFRGLDKVYANHSKIGAIAFSMLLFHPLMLVVKYIAISTNAAALFFVPFTNMPITWGIISLFLMIVFLSITFYFKIKYNKWKISHKFMTLAFFFGVIHTFMISSDVSRNMLLRYYILGLALLALVVITRKVVYEKLTLNRYKYKVKNVLELNKDIIEIEMEALDKKMIYSSGQFAFFEFLSSGVSSESHPFSLSSSERDNNLKITVKNLGDYTSALKGLRQGDGVVVDGPYGNFSFRNVTNKNQVWIAGGIGITPFYSMAQVLDPSYHIDFYYSVKEKSEAVYIKELEDIANQNPNFKFILWCADEKGYISGSAISSLSGGTKDKDFFFCGPPMLMDSLKNQFVNLGVDIKDIHYEDFSFFK
ncbi:ferric reductase-like transmembrane domain-containing protein [Candidatus Nomurabacteria bacterium]|nr:ferric reductase-like transmembrane domain-containing protein [Candidatus Nomurabacteria bacterium]